MLAAGLVLLTLSCSEGPPDTAAGFAWSELPPLPDGVGVAGSCAGVSGGALLVAGGANFPNGPPWEGHAKVWHDRVLVLTEPGGEWRTAALRLPRPLAYGVAMTWNDRLVCVGGGDAARHYPDSFALRWNGREAASIYRTATHSSCSTPLAPC